MLRIDGTIYFIYSKNPFSKEVAKQYKLKIEELQKMIGNNAKKERIDSSVNNSEVSENDK
ncbi:MAG: hypothetical protein HXL69_03695 [Dialister invisus]|nr:hypothetical protein [Dialister invisus]